jgi:hypothetical protein
MGTKVYAFHDGRYIRYDRVADRVDDGYPLDVAGNWPGLGAIGCTRPDAVANLHDGKLSFFIGDHYARYDIANDHVDEGYPRPIADGWPGFADAGFAHHIDAAVTWPSGKVYLFSGDRYVRYDPVQDGIDAGYPLPIAQGWPALAGVGITAGVTGGIDWGDGTVYLFAGNRYVAYDVATDTVRDGRAKEVGQHWPGIADAGFGSGFTAVTDLWSGSELWLDGVQRIVSPKRGPRHLPVPWRGVLHTTEGGTIEGALQSYTSTNFYPHFTLEPRTGRLVQHLPLTVGARALSDKVTPWPNACHCIQIEIVGHARNTHTWAEENAPIRDLVQRIEDLVPIPHRTSRVFRDVTGVAAHPSNRMDAPTWTTFAGWCGHQHVPGETHWDPGALDIAAVLS